jgi:AraC-like DNA-binding protein
MPERIRIWHPAGMGDVELWRGIAVTEPYPRHWHEEYQLCLILAGDGELTYRGRHHATPTNSLFIVHPGEVHGNYTDCEGGCSYRSVYVSPEIFRRVASDLAGRCQLLPFFPDPMIFDQALLDLYLKLHLLLETPDSSLASESLLLELCANLIRRYSQESPAVKTMGRERRTIQRIREYLTESYVENVSLKQLADAFGLSPFHLSRLFCREIGMPPHAFQTQVRIARAKTLLRQGLSITDVAMLTGFSDQSHLTRHFKRLVKLTPGQYREGSKNVQDNSGGPR